MRPRAPAVKLDDGAGRTLIVRARIAWLPSEDVDGMAEADFFKSHDERNHVAALVTLPKTMPQVLGRRDDKGGFAVVMERAAPDQVLPLALKLDPSPPA